MTNYGIRIKGDRAIREMEKAQEKAQETAQSSDCVLVQPDPNAHLGGVESE